MPTGTVYPITHSCNECRMEVSMLPKDLAAGRRAGRCQNTSCGGVYKRIQVESKTSSPEKVRGLLEELRAMLVEGDSEKKKSSKHYPFKRKPELGPGPRGGNNKKSGQYKCSCGNYSCKCSGPNGPVKIKIDKGYKSAYNHAYKQWRRFHKM